MVAMHRFLLMTFLVLTVMSGSPASRLLPAQSVWTMDGEGALESEVGPLPGWNSGRVLLTDRLDARLAARQTLERVTFDYHLGGYLDYTSERDVTGDLSQLNVEIAARGFSGERGLFRTSLGRIGIEEPSGFVFRQPGDGLATEISLPAFDLELTVAYLGLLLKWSNEALLSTADQVALSDPNVVLAPSRGIGMLRLSLPELLFRNDLSLWGMYLLGFANLEPAGRWYAGGSFRGPVWGPIGERFDFVGGAEIPAHFSFLTRGAVLIDLPRSVGSRVQTEFLFASGNTPRLSAFLPLTGDIAGVVFATPYENLIRLSLDYSLRPFEKSQVEWYHAIAPFVASRWYFHPSSSPAPAVSYTPPGSYYGTELEFGVSYKHATDPGLKVSGGFFADASGKLQWFGTGALSVSF